MFWIQVMRLFALVVFALRHIELTKSLSDPQWEIWTEW